MDYAVSAAASDKAKQEKVVNGLVGYTQDVGAFLSAANPTCRGRWWRAWWKATS